MKLVFSGEGKGKIRTGGLDGLVENCLKLYVKRSDNTVRWVTAHQLADPSSRWDIDQSCTGISNAQLNGSPPQ